MYIMIYIIRNRAWRMREIASDTNVSVDRTSELRKKGYIGRRLGPKQMTTDTAVRVTRMVVHERGRSFSSTLD